MTEEPKEIIQREQPREITSYGNTAAKELMKIVKTGNWSVNIQNNNYLKFEAWQTLGRFYGYTVKTANTNHVVFGAVQGFEATAEIIDVDGKTVGSADAMCLNDEANWKNKPLFQLRSMAQTRACAKAYRQVLSWVAVLAGYEPTPAEEMEGVSNGNGKLATDKQKKLIFALGKDLGLDDTKTKETIKVKFGLESFTELTMAQASESIEAMQEKIKEKDSA